MIHKLLIAVIVLSLLTAIFFLRRRQTTEFYCRKKLPFSLSPEHVVFAIDLNGVILKAKISQMIPFLWHKLTFVQFALSVLNPLFWPFIMYMRYHSMHTQEEFDEFAKKNPAFRQWKAFFINLMSLQKLNKNMVARVQVLRAQGFHVYALSNMWPSTLEKMRKKFHILDALFDGYFIPTLQEPFYKPEPQFYLDFITYIHKKHGKKKIIFFDDTYANVIAARSVGIYAFNRSSLKKVIACSIPKN